MTTKTAGQPGGPKVWETGNMFFFETKSGKLLSEFRNPRPTNDNTSPTTGKYCSSHLGIPVPSKDRYLLVNAYYRGGSSVIELQRPDAAEGDRVRRHGRHEHVVGVHVPAPVR